MTAYLKATVREPGPSRLELLELVNKRQGWAFDCQSLIVTDSEVQLWHISDSEWVFTLSQRAGCSVGGDIIN